MLCIALCVSSREKSDQCYGVCVLSLLSCSSSHALMALRFSLRPSRNKPLPWQRLFAATSATTRRTSLVHIIMPGNNRTSSWPVVRRSDALPSASSDYARRWDHALRRARHGGTLWAIEKPATLARRPYYVSLHPALLLQMVWIWKAGQMACDGGCPAARGRGLWRDATSAAAAAMTNLHQQRARRQFKIFIIQLS